MEKTKDKNYSLILFHHRQKDRVLRSIEIWMNQTIPPEEIIVIDDDPDIPFVNKTQYDNVAIYNYHSEGNIGKLLNYGISKTTTEKFFTAEPSLVPIGQYFMEKMLKRSAEKTIAIPVYCTSESYAILKGKGDFVAYQHQFGTNIPFPKAMNPMLFQGFISADKSEVGRSCHNLWYPPEGHLRYKSTFLNYNETYDCWGCYDIDYMSRMVNDHFRVKTYTDMGIVHIDHLKIGQMYSKPRNLKYLRHCLDYYHKYQISKLSSSLALDIRNQYSKT